MSDLSDLIEATEDLLAELARDGQSPTIAIPKLKQPDHPGRYKPDKAKTGGDRPKNKKPKKDDDGEKTGAGVQHKDVGGTGNTGTHMRVPKTAVMPARDREKTNALPADQKSKKTKTSAGKGGEKPSCPGGQQPRMVFGKWRCSGASSKGSKQAKSRIATKRQKKGQKKGKAPKGVLAKLVHKARSALTSLFK